MRTACLSVVAATAWTLMPATVAAGSGQDRVPAARGCDELFRARGIIWRGTTSTMTLQDLASYAAPVFWLSPDEPLLKRQAGRDIRLPAAFPFDTRADSPIVYYEVTLVDELPRPATRGVTLDEADKGRSRLDLDAVKAVRIKYIAYFPEESGVGQHLHDVEPTELRLVIGRADGDLARSLGYVCDSTDYLIAVIRATGEAHGNRWYYNVLDVDAETILPIHMLVEEGKHATATDKNADGYYTPGYDVTVRINDAWGVRDTIRGGTLFTGKFEAFMAKVRKPEHRILPPLPEDSPLHERLRALDADPSTNAVYALRSYPAAKRAANDKLLEHKIHEKETRNWPVTRTSRELLPIVDALADERELKPFSVAFRADGKPGLAIAFPLLVVKNVQEPMSAGYFVNRVYFRDRFKDWGWMVMYTPSASRWFDQYLAAGLETDRFSNDDGIEAISRRFALETGIKLRFRSPNRVLGVLAHFWGFRAGVRGLGGIDIDELTYVFEIGAGVW